MYPVVSETKEEKRKMITRDEALILRGKDAEAAYDDYIKGVRSFAEVSDDYKG